MIERYRRNLLLESRAGYSECDRYRYFLRCELDYMPSPRQRCVFIGLNPSTATESVNDPTIRRCIGYAERWGFRELVMLNAFAFRSTDPRGLLTVDDPVGPENDATLLRWTADAGRVVCAWGFHAGERGARVLELLAKAGIRLHCLGKTKGGAPKHPLYLRADAEVVELSQ